MGHIQVISLISKPVVSPIDFGGRSRCDVSSAVQMTVGQKSQKACWLAYCDPRPDVAQHPDNFGILPFPNSVSGHPKSPSGILNSAVVWVLERREGLLSCDLSCSTWGTGRPHLVWSHRPAETALCGCRSDGGRGRALLLRRRRLSRAESAPCGARGEEAAGGPTATTPRGGRRRRQRH